LISLLLFQIPRNSFKFQCFLAFFSRLAVLPLALEHVEIAIRYEGGINVPKNGGIVLVN
jgi:hypothetical protein